MMSNYAQRIDNIFIAWANLLREIQNGMKSEKYSIEKSHIRQLKSLSILDKGA